MTHARTLRSAFTFSVRGWTSLLVFVLFHAVTTSRAELLINEVFFNPPGAMDAPNEFIELRGTANLTLTNTYFLAVEGNSNGNPGFVQNVFDLSGVRVGGNGFILILQNSNTYVVNTNATILLNTNGTGFGSGSDSSARHRGRDGHAELESASTTFLLVQSPKRPDPGDDIDPDDDGVPDGDKFASWTVLDSVGVLDVEGAGDIAYGRINFIRADAAGGTVALAVTNVPLAFTPGYVARVKNSTNWTAAAWVAGDELTLNARGWALTAGKTFPAKLARKRLNHSGAPNFGGAALPGVLARESGGGTDVTEGGAADSYTLALNARARRGLTVQISAPSPLEVSIDKGRTFGATRLLKFTGLTRRTVLVRARDDAFVSARTRPATITHSVVLTGDPVNYPTNVIFPDVAARVTDSRQVLLGELKVNPPGPEDAPFEFVELRGTPGAVLTNLFFVVLDGNEDSNPGTATTVVNLAGAILGTNGLLMIAAPGHPYAVFPGTPVLPAPQLLRANDGGLGNGSVTFLLVSTASAIAEGADLDSGDNGNPEGLPDDAVIVDSLAWDDDTGNDTLHTGAVLKLAARTPDAATRFLKDSTPNSAAAWFGGDLDGTNGASLAYDAQHVTTNFPSGTTLSPGVVNHAAPQISFLAPGTGVIGDTTSPPVLFLVSDDVTPAASLLVTASSSDPEIVPDANLVLTGTGSARTLTIRPVGVGYATITIRATDGEVAGARSFAFAASADLRGGGRFHSGASDASTAMALDADWMLVGDDENQLLRFYSRSNSGPPVRIVDMNPFLGLNDFYDDGRPKEVDIEGSTRVGNRIYWIGSHSHAQDTEIRTNRARLFATDIAPAGTNTTVTYAGRYEFLKADLLAWDTGNIHGRGAGYYGLAASAAPGVDPKSPDGSGFNIEGLAMSPDDTNTAFLCFRAPLIPPGERVKALIVPITNFPALAISGAVPGAARFGAPIELNLGGRGVRSIEGIGTNYLLVTGPPGPASNAPPLDFKLFTWSGRAAEPPRQRAADLAGLNPEGIVGLPPPPWTDASPAQLLSDNGTTVYYGDGIEAKHLPVREFKKSRADWVTLGAVVMPPPVFRSAKQAVESITITWLSVAGVTYRVQGTATLADAAWTDLPGDVTATDATASKTVTMQGASGWFFRVVVVP